MQFLLTIHILLICQFIVRYLPTVFVSPTSTVCAELGGRRSAPVKGQPSPPEEASLRQHDLAPQGPQRDRRHVRP